jgi:c-di-AMP phosphodiesterase-like protein
LIEIIIQNTAEFLVKAKKRFVWILKQTRKKMTFFFNDDTTAGTIMIVDYEDLCVLIAEEYVDNYDEHITEIDEIDSSVLKRIINGRIDDILEGTEEDIDDEVISRDFEGYQEKICQLIIERFEERELERSD